MICVGARECAKLKDAEHIIYYGDKEIRQRPEYCSGQHPHRFNHEECGSRHCVFLDKQVECVRLYIKNPELS